MFSLLVSRATQIIISWLNNAKAMLFASHAARNALTRFTWLSVGVLAPPTVRSVQPAQPSAFVPLYTLFRMTQHPVMQPVATQQWAVLCRFRMLMPCLALLAMLATVTVAPAVAQTANPADSSPKATLLVIGDSLSAEYGLRRGTGWVALVQQRLQETNPNYHVVNASVSGDTTSGGLSRLPRLLAEHAPAIVIIELGGNDALRGLSLKMTKENLQTMVRLSRDAGANVLLIGMQIPPNYGASYAERFAAIFGEVARAEDVALVPFLLDGIGTDMQWFQPDRIHPNEQAQPHMADTVWPLLEPLLKG